MSASNLYNAAGALVLPVAVSAPSALSASTAKGVIVVASGTSAVASGAGVVTIAYPGLLASDVVQATAKGPMATAGNAGVACAGWCTDNNLNLQSAFATTAENVAWLVLRYV